MHARYLPTINLSTTGREVERNVIFLRKHHKRARGLGATRALHIPGASLGTNPTLNGMRYVTMTTAPPCL